jgi:hypothetical protein
MVSAVLRRRVVQSAGRALFARRSAVPRCAVVRAYRGGPTTPGPSTASLGKFPSATWNPHPRRPAARRVAHRSVAVLPLRVRADRCRSPYRGLKAGVILRNEVAITLDDHVWFEDQWMVASWCDE